MRRIAAVTGARSDYGIYRPVFGAIAASPRLRLGLFVCGAHLSPEFGMTVTDIEQDGFPILERLDTLLSGDTPQAIAKSMGLGLLAFAAALARSKPDILLVLGDRYEMFAAAAAAVPFAVPIAHIHGGEATFGVIDESFRHAITKMSHLHFTATEAYARRVVQMGEEPWRVTASGAPALDRIGQGPALDKAALEASLGLDLSRRPILVTHHPASLDQAEAVDQTRLFFAALARTGLPLVVTYPNADANSRGVLAATRECVEAIPRARLLRHLGADRYLSLIPHVAALAGNSSSGIIEAASFAAPVVNVGERQAGRVRGPNVIDAPYEPRALDAALALALSPGFRQSLAGMRNPYGDGRAAPRIVEVLETVALGPRLLCKRFHDLPAPQPAGGGRTPTP